MMSYTYIRFGLCILCMFASLSPSHVSWLFNVLPVLPTAHRKVICPPAAPALLAGAGVVGYLT